MKTLHALITALSMAILLSVSAHANEAGFAYFAIDKSLFEQLSSTQQSALITKTQELTKFIETKVKTQIPNSLLEKTKDLKIKILLTDKAGRDGLFLPHESGEQTIAIQLVQLHSNGINALIAHEIYHAIHFTINPDEAGWVREGMAQLFEFITTGELNGRNLAAAINNPLTPLLGDYDVDEANPAQYGHNQLYFYYLYAHCGRDDFFWKLSEGEDNSGLRGSFLIDSVLEKINNTGKSECSNFTDSAISFEVAKAHNQIQFTSTKEKHKYSVYPGDISPRFLKANTAEGLKAIIQAMPVLSSFRIPLKDYKNFKGDCENCALFYAQRSFPFEVNEEEPKTTNDIDLILVKLRRN